MNNNINKKTIPEPLLFIHTVRSEILQNGSQIIYDSRSHQKIKPKEIKVALPIQKEIDPLLRQKIENIVKMYEMNNPIPCMIETINNTSIEGIPQKIEASVLYIKSNEEIIEIAMSEIRDVIILKI